MQEDLHKPLMEPNPCGLHSVSPLLLTQEPVLKAVVASSL